MLLTSSVLSATSKQCFELTSSVLSTTSKQCFEQPAASFLVCFLIFIEYKMPEKEHKRAHKKRQKQDLLNKGSLFDRLSCSCLHYLRVLVPLSYTFQEILSIEKWKFQALKSENRPIESQYVFDMLVMKLVIVSPSCSSLIV